LTFWAGFVSRQKLRKLCWSLIGFCQVTGHSEWFSKNSRFELSEQEVDEVVSQNGIPSNDSDDKNGDYHLTATFPIDERLSSAWWASAIFSAGKI